MDAGIALNAAKCRNAGSTRRKSASSESGGGAASTGAEYSMSETSFDPYKSDDPPYFNNDGTKKKKKRKHPKGSAKKRSKTAKDPLDNDILEGFGGGIGQNSIITDHLKAQAGNEPEPAGFGHVLQDANGERGESCGRAYGGGGRQGNLGHDC
jgi:hypothetical protein